MFKPLAESSLRTNLASVRANTNVSRKNRSGEVRRTKSSKEVTPQQQSKPERGTAGGGKDVVGSNKQYVQRGGEEGGRSGGIGTGKTIVGGVGKKDKRTEKLDKGGASGSGT